MCIGVEFDITAINADNNLTAIDSIVRAKNFDCRFRNCFSMISQQVTKYQVAQLFQNRPAKILNSRKVRELNIGYKVNANHFLLIACSLNPSILELVLRTHNIQLKFSLTLTDGRHG